MFIHGGRVSYPNTHCETWCLCTTKEDCGLPTKTQTGPPKIRGSTAIWLIENVCRNLQYWIASSTKPGSIVPLCNCSAVSRGGALFKSPITFRQITLEKHKCISAIWSREPTWAKCCSAERRFRATIQFNLCASVNRPGWRIYPRPGYLNHFQIIKARERFFGGGRGWEEQAESSTDFPGANYLYISAAGGNLPDREQRETHWERERELCRPATPLQSSGGQPLCVPANYLSWVGVLPRCGLAFYSFLQNGSKYARDHIEAFWVESAVAT